MPGGESITGTERGLALYHDDFAWLNRGQSGVDLGKEGEQVIHVSWPRNHQHQGDARFGDVLLMAKVLVDREENLEAGREHQVEKLAVLLFVPPHIS